MKYRVRSHITSGAGEHLPGSEIELTEAQAAAMPWAVEAMPQSPVAPPLPVTETKKGK